MHPKEINEDQTFYADVKILGLIVVMICPINESCPLILDYFDKIIDGASDIVDVGEKMTLPGGTVAAGVLEWMEIEIIAKVSGTKYVWYQDTTWIIARVWPGYFCAPDSSKAPYWKGTPWSTEVPLYTRRYTFDETVDLLNPAGLEEFLERTQTEFANAAAELRTKNIDAQQAIESAVGSSGVYPWDE